MSKTLIIRDAILARQLKADQRARGIARRMSATTMRAWPHVLELIPATPTSYWRPQLTQALTWLRGVLQKQLQRELNALSLWAGTRAAQSLSSAFQRHYDIPLRIEPAAQFPNVAPFVPVNVPGRFPLQLPPIPSAAPQHAPPVKPPPKPPALTGFPEPEGRFEVGGLIEPPSAFEIMRIVGPAHEKLTKLFDVDRVAGTVWQGIANGDDRRAIAKTLRTVLNNDVVAARRVARTEGGRVATQSQLAVSEQLADEIVGYQVIAVPKTEYSRPDHLKRSGTIYYRHPTGSQLGFDKLPQPPLEADGTISWNCRCHLAPIFSGEPIPVDDGFGNKPSLQMAAAAA